MAHADLTQPKHQHPNGGSCWTPSRCKALAALAELRTAAVRYDDHEFSARLDDIEAALGLGEVSIDSDEWDTYASPVPMPGTIG